MVSVKVSTFALAFGNERQQVQHKPSEDVLLGENIMRVKMRAFSSAGSEHLPYKQRVGGSNPSTPTRKRNSFGSLAQLNRAFDYGSKGYRFESCASHA